MKKSVVVLTMAALIGGLGVSAPMAATAAPSNDAMVSEPCGGNPDIDLWYDQDQYGSYTKISFTLGHACAVTRVVSGIVFCTSPYMRRIYEESTQGTQPLRTSIRTLPDDCTSFLAEGTVGTLGGGTWLDRWQWDKGDYPA